MDRITKSWLLLIGLSFGSTGIALLLPDLSGAALKIVCAAILLIAGGKAALILSDYLELRHAARWRDGVGLVIGLFLLLALGLYLAG